MTALPPESHLVLIDGMSFIFRAYHAVRGNLTRTDGLPVNALFGFSQMLVKVVKELAPSHAVVVLDSKPPNWRHHLYGSYKANRPPPDEALLKQIPFMEPLIDAFGLPCLRKDGFEADDIIATLVGQNIGKATRITIVTSDKDLLQLVGDKEGTQIRLFDTFKDAWQGTERALEKFGVTPDKVLDVQALMGDSSDNIPGVPGIGPKTAAQLINEFGSLAEVYDQLPLIKNEKLRQKLADNKDNAFLSYKLAGLDANVTWEAKPLTLHAHLHEAAEYLRKELEFNTLANRLETGHKRETERDASLQSASLRFAPPSAASAAADTGPWGPYEMLTTPEQWQNWLSQIRAQKFVALDTETTSLQPYEADLVGISFALSTNKACYVPLSHVEPGGPQQSDLFGAPQLVPDQLDKTMVLKDLRALLEDPTIKIVLHNAKYDMLVLARAFGVIPTPGSLHPLYQLFNNLEDTLLISGSLDAGRWNHGLDSLSERHLGHKNIPYEEVAGKGKSQILFSAVPLDKATAYAAEDADATLRLYELLHPRLASESKSPEYGPTRIYDIERTLLPTVTGMEATGVCLNTAHLRNLSNGWAEELAGLEKTIHTLAGHEFNVNSPSQLAQVMFTELGLGTTSQQKKGSTGVEVLEYLADTSERDSPGKILADTMLTYRQLSKLRNTYAEVLPKQLAAATNRVHTSYQQIGASTGRFSSTDPNLQNIPIRSEEGRKVRSAFIPQPGWTMLAADYSQIELRLLAHFSGSKGLTQAFTEGLDIHAYTAALVAGKDIKDVTKDERRAAKFVNFGLVYGMGARSLAMQIGCSISEAQTWIDAYFTRYEGVRDYMESNKEFARKHGYVETLLGRKVWLPDIKSSHGGLRANAERAAINAPLQGSNADVIKLAMPHIADLLAEKYQSKMLMQVHDELVLESPADEIESLKQALPPLMTGVVRLNVPLAVEVGTGPTWEEAH